MNKLTKNSDKPLIASTYIALFLIIAIVAAIGNFSIPYYLTWNYLKQIITSDNTRIITSEITINEKLESKLAAYYDDTGSDLNRTLTSIKELSEKLGFTYTTLSNNKYKISITKPFLFEYLLGSLVFDGVLTVDKRDNRYIYSIDGNISLDSPNSEAFKKPERLEGKSEILLTSSNEGPVININTVAKTIYAQRLSSLSKKIPFIKKFMLEFQNAIAKRIIS